VYHSAAGKSLEGLAQAEAHMGKKTIELSLIPGIVFKTADLQQLILYLLTRETNAPKCFLFKVRSCSCLFHRTFPRIECSCT